MKQGRTVLRAKRYGVHSCPSDWTLLQAAREMYGKRISGLVVVNPQGHLEGDLSRVDLVRAHLAVEDWAAEPVSSYVNRDVITVKVDQRLDDVAQMMLEKKVRRVVVVDDVSKPVALISDSDLVFHMLRDA